MKTFKIQDIRNLKAFPNLLYRFGNIEQTSETAILERDFLGENPLHYYLDSKAKGLIVASNIADIKSFLKDKGRVFAWDRVRAVSNNTRTTIDNTAFSSVSPREEEL